MNENHLHSMIDDVRAGRMSRRELVCRLAAAGVSAPVVWHLLAHAGVAQAAEAPDFNPPQAGGGGVLKALFWQATTLLNPHFAVGTKDQAGCRLFYEPLAGWDAEGNLYPVLAAAIPSRENGGLSDDGKSVTWTLKPGVKWHDGAPFTADDVVFNWHYASDPATAAVTVGSYTGRSVEKIDDLTVRITFASPTPFWADAFCGAFGMIIPKHLFGDYVGDKSRDAPANLAPVGTGPYKFSEFRPGDFLSATRNPDYHVANRPFFDAVEIKGGGDAASAARAVMQAGEYDFAKNIQLEDSILRNIEESGKGHVEMIPCGDVEILLLNAADPSQEVDGERSSVKTQHPAFRDPAVRHAMHLLCDQGSMQKFIYGRTAVATANVLNGPPRYASTDAKWEFDIDRAAKMLDDAGWKPGSDGVRVKDGVALRFLFQTSINTPRQKCQQVIKQACQKAGIALELKAVPASVFFSSDVANPDTYTKFYADMEMYTYAMYQPDPGGFMKAFCSWDAASKANKWLGTNVSRWQNPEYDRLYAEAARELDPVKRVAMYIRLNDMAVAEYCKPLLFRFNTNVVSNRLVVRESGWDCTFSELGVWHRAE